MKSALSCEMLCPGFPSDSFCPEYSVSLFQIQQLKLWEVKYIVQATSYYMPLATIIQVGKPNHSAHFNTWCSQLKVQHAVVSQILVTAL